MVNKKRYDKLSLMLLNVKMEEKSQDSICISVREEMIIIFVLL